MKTIRAIDFDRKLIARDDLPLYGKRVLFTSPRNYAVPLGQLLIQRGARPVWMPTIEIWPMPDYDELDQVIKNLSDYDWLAFSSENGIEPFCSRLTALGLDASAITRAGTKIAAFRMDSLVLEKAGLSPDLIPREMSTGGVIEEFRNRGITNGSVIVPCPRVSGVVEPYVIPQFISDFENLGMTAKRLEVYRTMAVEEIGPVEKELLLNEKIDICIFTSSGEIFSFLNHLQDRLDIVNKSVVAYMGSFTSKTGGEVGLNVDIVPENFTMRGLLEALEAYYRA